MDTLAVLIDGENIDAKEFVGISAHFPTLGAVSSVRVFCDPSNNRWPGWINVCRQHGLQPEARIAPVPGKNSTDIAMTIAAMDELYRGATAAFCLVSSDRDFAPLAARLRAAGKAVTIIGRHPDERLRLLNIRLVELDAADNAPNQAPLPKRQFDLKVRKEIEAMGFIRGQWLGLGLAGNNLRKNLPEKSAELTGPGKLRGYLAELHFEESGKGSALQLRYL